MQKTPEPSTLLYSAIFIRQISTQNILSKAIYAVSLQFKHRSLAPHYNCHFFASQVQTSTIHQPFLLDSVMLSSLEGVTAVFFLHICTFTSANISRVQCVFDSSHTSGERHFPPRARLDHFATTIQQHSTEDIPNDRDDCEGSEEKFKDAA